MVTTGAAGDHVVVVLVVQATAAGGAGDAAGRRGRVDQRLLDEAALGQQPRGVRGRVGHLADPLPVDVVDRVAGQVVAVVVLLAGRAAVDRRLVRGLDALRAGEQTTGRDLRLDERAVVGTAAERGLRGGQPDATEVVVEDPLDLTRTVGAVRRPRTDRVLGVVPVVDEPDVVRRADHVEVEVERDRVLLGLAQPADVVARAEQPELLGTPEREPDLVPRLEPPVGDRLGDLQDTRRTGPVVVDAGPARDAVEVGADDDHVVRVASGRLGEDVVGRPGLVDPVDPHPGLGPRRAVEDAVAEVVADRERRADHRDADSRRAQRSGHGGGAAGLPLVEDDHGGGACGLGVVRLGPERAGPALDQGDGPGREAREVCCLAAAGVAVHGSRRRDHEVHGRHGLRDVAVARVGHRREVGAVLVGRPVGCGLGEDRRGRVRVERELERLDRDVVARGREAPLDVVHRLVEGGEAGDPVAAVVVRDLLERREVLLHPGDGDGLAQALGDGQVFGVWFGTGPHCRDGEQRGDGARGEHTGCPAPENC